MDNLSEANKIAVSQIVYPPLRPVSDDDLIKIIKEIDSAQQLLDQGLLREKEFNDVSSRAKDAYENTANHNSIQYRKYDKSRRANTVWRSLSRSGYVQEGSGWSFGDIRQQIAEILDLKGVPATSPEELFLPPNSEFDSRRAIRNILSGATISIDIKDDYLFTVNNRTKNIEMLYILGPYLGTSLGIKVRLLGLEKELPSAVSDINAFLTQYEGKTLIRGNVSGKDNKRESHDRFIIIDNKNVYQIGASIKDLGKTQTSIIEIIDKQVCNQFIEQFDEWWNTAVPYSTNEA